MIIKSKIYLKPQEKPPGGMRVQRGPKGGLYYETKLKLAPIQEETKISITDPDKVADILETEDFDELPLTEAKSLKQAIRLYHSHCYDSSSKSGRRLRDLISKIENGDKLTPNMKNLLIYKKYAEQWFKAAYEDKETVYRGISKNEAAKVIYSLITNIPITFKDAQSFSFDRGCAESFNESFIIESDIIAENVWTCYENAAELDEDLLDDIEEVVVSNIKDAKVGGKFKEYFDQSSSSERSKFLTNTIKQHFEYFTPEQLSAVKKFMEKL